MKTPRETTFPDDRDEVAKRFAEAKETRQATTFRTSFYNDRFIGFSGCSRDEYYAPHKGNDMPFVFKGDIPTLPVAMREACAGELGVAIDRGITSEDSIGELCSLFARIRKGKSKLRVSLQMHSGPNKHEWFECNAAAVFDAEGLPDHAVLVFHNITEQRIKVAAILFKAGTIGIEASVEFRIKRIVGAVRRMHGSMVKLIARATGCAMPTAIMCGLRCLDGLLRIKAVIRS